MKNREKISEGEGYALCPYLMLHMFSTPTEIVVIVLVHRGGNDFEITNI